MTQPRYIARCPACDRQYLDPRRDPEQELLERPCPSCDVDSAPTGRRTRGVAARAAAESREGETTDAAADG